MRNGTEWQDEGCLWSDVCLFLSFLSHRSGNTLQTQTIIFFTLLCQNATWCFLCTIIKQFLILTLCQSLTLIKPIVECGMNIYQSLHFLHQDQSQWLICQCLSGLADESDPLGRWIGDVRNTHAAPQTEEPWGSCGLIRFVLQRSTAHSTSNIYGSRVRKTDIWDQLSERWLTWLLLILCCSPNHPLTHAHTTIEREAEHATQTEHWSGSAWTSPT